jgi:hypothetical protein
MVIDRTMLDWDLDNTSDMDVDVDMNMCSDPKLSSIGRNLHVSSPSLLVIVFVCR